MIYSKNPWTNKFQLILSGAICRAKVAGKARDKVEAKVEDSSAVSSNWYYLHTKNIWRNRIWTTIWSTLYRKGECSKSYAYSPCRGRYELYTYKYSDTSRTYDQHYASRKASDDRICKHDECPYTNNHPYSVSAYDHEYSWIFCLYGYCNSNTSRNYDHSCTDGSGASINPCSNCEYRPYNSYRSSNSSYSYSK